MEVLVLNKNNMEKLYKELETLLGDFQSDRARITDSANLALGYADDFYDMLVRIKDKLNSFLYSE